MELTKLIEGRDAKLDGMLSLLMKEYDDNNTSLQHFYNSYHELFGDDLYSLQEILSEDGLVKCFVGAEGLEIEITKEGMQFMSKGGYSHEIREELVHHGEALKSMRNIKFWNTIVVSGFFLALILCFFLTHKKS